MGNHKIFFEMFKFAALTAAVSAGWRDEIEQESALEMWKYTVHEKEMAGLKKHADALEAESKKYEMQMQKSAHGKQFEAEVTALVHTKEFVALAKYVEAMKKKGPTEQIKKFAEVYKVQMHKVQMAHHKMEMTAQKNAKVWGTDGDHHMTVDIDNDQWYEFNAEYYKLREMEYYAMYKIPEFVKLREHMHAVKATAEMKKIQGHWKGVTSQDQHQVVVKHQANLLIEFLKCIHMSEEDKKWVDPHYSPVMFEVWHMVYLYFVAVGKGDLEPALDFMIDGKYDEKFVKEVDPKFGKPEENLYLF